MAQDSWKPTVVKHPRRKVNTLRPMNLKLAALIGAGAFLVLQSTWAETATDDVVVVSSRVSPDYSRKKLPDGSYARETFAFAKGGLWAGATSDPTMDRLQFLDVARTVAVSMRGQNYVPTRDPNSTRLLVMVYWGRTATPERASESLAAQELQAASQKISSSKELANHQFYNDPGTSLGASNRTVPCIRYTAIVTDTTDDDNAMSGSLAMVAAENRSRDQVNALNATMLGYDSWWQETESYKGTPREYRRQDMIDELEHDRYFVVVMAYDFQKIWKQKKNVVLWETRFSVRQRGHEFDKQLAAMAQNASQYYGRDTNGLVRKDLPAGHVDFGDLKNLGTVASK
jgi:hypothetical protein